MGVYDDAKKRQAKIAWAQARSNLAVKVLIAAGFERRNYTEGKVSIGNIWYRPENKAFFNDYETIMMGYSRIKEIAEIYDVTDILKGNDNGSKE